MTPERRFWTDMFVIASRFLFRCVVMVLGLSFHLLACMSLLADAPVKGQIVLGVLCAVSVFFFYVGVVKGIRLD